VKVPLWVVTPDFDRRNIYVHDSNEGFYAGQAQQVRIAIAECWRMRRITKAVSKSVIIVSRMRRVTESLHTSAQAAQDDN
jgi:hypothetical protein